MFGFSKNTRCRFLFVCVLLIFGFYQATDAQSGRRIKKADSSEQKAQAETKPAQTEKDVRKNTPNVARISSLLVVGEIQHSFAFFKSNEIDAALKEFVRFLKDYSKSQTEVTRGGGKVSYKEAKELAEKQNGGGAHVLWLGFDTKDDGYGNLYIAAVQYAVLTPETARIVTRGEIDPKENKIATSVGVLQIPNGKGSASALLQMKQGVREIAAILMRGGWLD
jgi:hypothetical protein